MNVFADSTYKRHTVTRRPAGVGAHVIWAVHPPTGRRTKHKELVRDIAPDAETAMERATTFIDQLKDLAP